MMDCVAVEDVTLRRGGRLVVRGLSFTVQPGEWLWLRGPNGSGKTTLLRALAGLSAPVAGKIDCPSPVLLGPVPMVKDTLTVAEHLAWWGVAAPCPALLDGIRPDAPGRALSSGQRQRLHLSRLSPDHKIWLLDEPLNALDDASIAVFRATVADHLARGGIAVVASHVPLGLAGGQEIALVPAAAQQRPAGFDSWEDE